MHKEVKMLDGSATPRTPPVIPSGKINVRFVMTVIKHGSHQALRRCNNGIAPV
jgi:hypothetical protein